MAHQQACVPRISRDSSQCSEVSGRARMGRVVGCEQNHWLLLAGVAVAAVATVDVAAAAGMSPAHHVSTIHQLLQTLLLDYNK